MIQDTVIILELQLYFHHNVMFPPPGNFHLLQSVVMNICGSAANVDQRQAPGASNKGDLCEKSVG